MNENSQNNHQDYHEDRWKRREERRQRREERHSGWMGGEWIIGVVLILVGLLLFGRNLNIVNIQNWWALFILLPALGSFSTAWRIVTRTGGHFNGRARSAVIFGLGLCLVTVIGLFNLNWTIFGPGLLLLVGLGLLINGAVAD